ncbi:hypothetical protein N5P37_011609, partial [Trichoderma harzianum]
LPQQIMHVVIAGAGLGGLSCAIACRKCDPPLKVTILERSPEFQPIGAGIQLPPNATRIMEQYGLLETLKDVGAVVMQNHTLRRYSTGEVIVNKPLGARAKQIYGAEWMVIHRADYQRVLLQHAQNLGAEIQTGAEVVGVSSGYEGEEGKRNQEKVCLILKDGQRVYGDAVIGADGLWSVTREHVLGRPSPPVETGDLAYRGTFTRSQLRQLNDEKVNKLLDDSNIQVWLGPEKHVVFYPVRNGTEFNLVLIRPDNLPSNVRTFHGNLEEMKDDFEGWDPTLRTLISCLSSALKWKLCHHSELETWVKDSVALLGDASHPTLPYQAQGAAMAVEDGAVIGFLLGRLQGNPVLWSEESGKDAITTTLKLYEKLRKQRTTVNVLGAVQARVFYHLPDGSEQLERDRLLSELPESRWESRSKWNWGDAEYQQALLGFDTLADAAEHSHKLFEG